MITLKHIHHHVQKHMFVRFLELLHTTASRQNRNCNYKFSRRSQARCPSCHPTNSVKATTTTYVRIHTRTRARARARAHTHTHTHTQFNGPFSGTTCVSQYQKGKPIWILLKQETVSGNGISWAICKSAPHSRQTTTPAPHHSVFYRPYSLLAAQPTASKH